MAHTDARTVPFRGKRTAEAPMTWGQRAIWKSIRWLDDEAHYFNIRRIAAVPPERTIDQVAAALSALLSRHEALRTRFRETPDGRWLQHVASEGDLPFDVLDAPPATAVQVVEEVADELAGRTFRHADELPFRCALVLDDGRPAHLALVFSHLGADFWGVRELERELSELLLGDTAPEPDWQPLDQAGFETDGPGAARGAAAVTYWRKTLDRVPATLFPAAGDQARPERFVRLGMDSPATALAATVLADRCQVSTGTVLLAATATVLGAYTGHTTVPLQLIAVNRHDERTRRLVAAMAENALFSLDVGEGTFDQTVRGAFLAGMNAYRHAHYDPLAVDEVLEEARIRSAGTLNLGQFFNDKRMHDRWESPPVTDGSAHALAALAAKTRISHVGSWERQDATFFVHTKYAPDTCLLYLMADTDLIARRDVERLLLAFESLLVQSVPGPFALSSFRATAPRTTEPISGDPQR